MAKFKTRARTLDLLGRQQIAGIPTAINELFKNAHDAYADKVEVDYFRKEKLFVLRDDGLGMTMNDFESRWLTLGTESKFTNRKIPPPPKDPNKPKRPIMGEKGIGRLAIASIGRQMLVLTKAERMGESHDLVAAFINWGIFELPGLNLDDVIIPLREFPSGSLPSKENIDEMKSEMIKSIAELVEKEDITEEEGSMFIDEIGSFDIDPIQLDSTLPGLSLANSGSGTHFYITPVDETLIYDIDGQSGIKDATKIEKMLVGFTNSMTPDHPGPVIEASFRDYRADDGTYFELLNKDHFITPEDFALADHHFNGEFDEFGQFKGVVKVFNEKEFEHTINWNGNNFQKTNCGPFSINVAYLQGALRHSTVDPENFARLFAKGEKYGGLYIYRDNIRILPYGNSSYDFIDIERNRTKSAAYYFFSYRRMFGVVDISKEKNSSLKEKAGREGFIENKGYRQIRDILKNFFVQLAADFFREGGGPKSEFWANRQKENDILYKAIEKRDKKAKARKGQFQKALNSFFDDISSNSYEDEIEQMLTDADRQFSSVGYIDDPDEASQALLDHESKVRESLKEITKKAKISQPRGFSISKELRQDWEAYLVEYEKLDVNILRQADDKIAQLVEDHTSRMNIEISKRKRLERAVDFISQEAKKAASSEERETREAAANISAQVKELTNDLMISLEDKIRLVKDNFKSLKMDGVGDFDLVSERKRMEDEIIKEKERSTDILESVRAQIEGIYWETDDEGNIITNTQMNEALEEELFELREKINMDVELSQLGLAVGVIHHEFNSTVTSMRNSIKELGAWADVNEEMESMYKNIRVNFEHLDGYLSLFSPLNRRLYRKEENIKASDINLFLLDIFNARLERHNIKIKHTRGFGKRSLFGYRSTFYPVFINIVDNAIYWLKQKEDEGDRIVRLHADDTGFYISNNGPAIKPNDKSRIFDLGFTRKPNGRGMGMYISKEVLNGVKYRIFVDEPREDCNVTFKIEPIENDSK